MSPKRSAGGERMNVAYAEAFLYVHHVTNG